MTRVEANTYPPDSVEHFCQIPLRAVQAGGGYQSGGGKEAHPAHPERRHRGRGGQGSPETTPRFPAISLHSPCFPGPSELHCNCGRAVCKRSANSMLTLSEPVRFSWFLGFRPLPAQDCSNVTRRAQYCPCCTLCLLVALTLPISQGTVPVTTGRPPPLARPPSVPAWCQSVPARGALPGG